MSKRLPLWIALALLGDAGLACTLAGDAASSMKPLPTNAATPQPVDTQPVVATFPPLTSPPPEATAGAAVSPAAPVTTERAADTATPTATTTVPSSAPTSKPTAAHTPKPAATTAPLSFEYEVVSIKRNPGEQAVMTLHVIAQGGAGGYKYYHDDIQQAGATFDVLGTCGKPFVHTIKVTSVDGQTVSKSYHVQGICPTPTP